MSTVDASSWVGIPRLFDASAVVAPNTENELKLLSVPVPSTVGQPELNCECFRYNSFKSWRLLITQSVVVVRSFADADVLKPSTSRSPRQHHSLFD